MSTLYLSAPKARVQLGSGFYRDFYTILQSRIGPDYAIYANIFAQLHPGIRVVVFDRDRRLQAEGVISAVEPRPGNRVQRYHVHTANLTQVPYTNPPGVNRCGVAFV
jgi:hypothetical protein